MSEPRDPGFSDASPGAAEELAEQGYGGGGEDLAFLEESQDTSTEEEERAAPPEPDGGGGEPTFADEAPATGRVATRSVPPPGKATGRLRPGPPGRPTGRLPGPPSPPAGKRPTPPGSSGRPPAGPAGSGLHGRPAPAAGTAPPQTGAARRPSSGSHRTIQAPTGSTPRPGPGPKPGGRSPSSSGELARVEGSGRRPSAVSTSSGAHKAHVFRAGTVPERSEAEDQAALDALRARAQPTPHGDPWLGRDVGSFRVEEFLEIDRGERRYIATHEETRLRVLLRVFPLQGGYADEFKRLADRGERSSKVEHPHLAHCLGAGRIKECFFVGVRAPMGPTLAELLAEGALPEKEVAQALEQVGRALQTLHGRDLVHGHVSPWVIRRERPGTFILWEAGLARPRPALAFLSSGGDVLGVPGFIAPETVDSGQQTRASDLYSLGCTAWALLSQRAPFTGEDEVQTLLDQLNLEVPPVAGTEKQPAPPGLSVVVQKLAGYTPDVRYRDAAELVHELKALERGEAPKPFPPPMRPDEAGGAPQKLSSHFLYLVVALLLLNVGALTVVVQNWLQARAIPLPDPLEGLSVPLPEPEPPR